MPRSVTAAPNVSRWRTPAAFFPWPHVRRSIDAIDAQVYRHAVRTAIETDGHRAKSCPDCGASPENLAWVTVTSPEETWAAGTGETGFLTICRDCRRQVDFLVDPELTALDAEGWREFGTFD